MAASGANRDGFTLHGVFYPVREWSQMEDRYLRFRWETGMSPAAIAIKLRRTQKSVRARAYRCRLKRPKQPA